MKLMKTHTGKRKLLKKGVSMVELMVSVAVLSIILSFVFSITGTGRISWYLSSAQVSLYSQARAAFSRISQELMLSSRSRIFPAADGNSIRFSIPIVDAGGNLVLDGNGNMQWGDADTVGNSINYTLVETNLIRQILNAANAPVQETNSTIARNITDFTVSADNLQYSLVLTATLTDYLGRAFPNPIVYTVSTAISPQN